MKLHKNFSFPDAKFVSARKPSVRVAHAADGLVSVLLYEPGRVLRLSHKALHQIPENIAHGLIDGAVVVHIEVGGHNGPGQGVSKFMGHGIVGFPVGVLPVKLEYVKALDFSAVAGIGDRQMIFS